MMNNIQNNTNVYSYTTSPQTFRLNFIPFACSQKIYVKGDMSLLHFLPLAIPRARECNFIWYVLKMSEDLRLLSRGAGRGKECVMELLEFLRVVLN
jgi:hypothetical protein